MQNEKVSKPTSPLKAIRAFCIECCGYQTSEVKSCTAPRCPLFEFRMGTNPYRKTKEYTEDELETLRERMKKAREAKDTNT